MKLFLSSALVLFSVSSAIASSTIELGSNQSVTVVNDDRGTKTVVTCKATSVKPQCGIVKNGSYFFAQIGKDYASNAYSALEDAIAAVGLLQKAGLCQ